MQRFDLTGKTALVTGAATGIGAGLAIGLAEAGADVTITSRDLRRLNETRDEIERLGRCCSLVQLDVLNESEVERVVRDIGPIDILVNNVGANLHKSVLDTTLDEWNTVIATNLTSVFLLSKLVAQKMVERGRGGKVINVSSTFAVVGFAGRSAYASAKAGVSELTRVTALEWADHKINVNAIAPTATRTPGREALFNDPKVRDPLIASIPLGKIGEVEDLVGAAIYLASSASDFVTGQTLFVDGGFTIR